MTIANLMTSVCRGHKLLLLGSHEVHFGAEICVSTRFSIAVAVAVLHIQTAIWELAWHRDSVKATKGAGAKITKLDVPLDGFVDKTRCPVVRLG